MALLGLGFPGPHTAWPGSIETRAQTRYISMLMCSHACVRTYSNTCAWLWLSEKARAVSFGLDYSVLWDSGVVRVGEGALV